MSLNSSAVIQNNTLTENNAAWDVYDIYEMSIIQLKNVAFTQNNFKGRLLAMISNCGAIIQNNIVIENNVPWAVYHLEIMSSTQLNDVLFTETISREVCSL